MKGWGTRVGKVSWTVLAVLLMPLLSPLVRNAEAQALDELRQLRQEMQALREEVQTKNDVIKRLQGRLDTIETKLQAEIQRPVEEKVTAIKEEMKTEIAAMQQAEAGRLMGGQVFFKGGFVRANHPRRNSLLTVQDDPNDKEGFQVGGGLDLPLMRIFGTTLLGEIYVEYIQTQKTTGAAPLPIVSAPDPRLAVGRGLENILTVAIAPKFRLDTLASLTETPWLASIRPWIIPVGLTFNVNTPVSKAITNISVGGVSGVGVERLFWNDRLSLGVDFRYYWGPDIPEDNLKRFTTGGYVGINF